MAQFCDLAAPGVRGLMPYQPGKPMAELEREYGISNVIKLASNENPLGPSPLALKAAQAALLEAHRYPDGNGFELKAALAAHHGVAPANITLGSGSNDCLEMIARAFLCPGRQALVAAHAFAIYGIAAQAVGATTCVAPAHPADHAMAYGHDLAAMAERIGPETAVVFIANPNNPTGTWLDAKELKAFIDALPENVICVVDEAYVEYAAGLAGYGEALPWLAQRPNLIITRTFSKAYGLAGLRVGYAICHPQIADLLNRVRMPFNVTTAALAAAAASLEDAAHVQAAVDLNRQEEVRLRKVLAEMGFSALPSAGNFLCVEVGPRAGEFYEGLLRRGVIVRPVAGYGLPHHLRVTIGLPAENARLLAALAELQQEGSVGA